MSDKVKCDICLVPPDQSNIAVYFCPEDKQNFCLKCATFHQRISTNSKHHLECLVLAGTEVPCLHQNEQAYYCEEHRQPCCAKCKQLSHNNCDQSIKETAEILSEGQELKDQAKEMLKELMRTKERVEELSKQSQTRESEWVNKLQQEVDRMNKAKLELERKINLKVDYIRKHMNQRREEIDKKINAVHNASNEIKKQLEMLNKDEISDVNRVGQIHILKQSLRQHASLLRADCEETQMAFLKTVEHDFEAEHYFSGSLSQFLDTVDSLNTIYSEVQQYMMAKSDKKMAIPHAELDKLNSDVWGDNTDDRNEEVERRRTKSEILKASEIVVATRNRPKSESAATGISTTPINTKGRETRKLKSVEEYESLVPEKELTCNTSIMIQSHCHMNVKAPSDKTACGITGVAKLDDGYLLMADFENKKLKLFAPCGDFKAELLCDVNPRDMAKLRENTVLVNFPMAKKMHFVTVESKTNANGTTRTILLGQKIETYAKCCGIAIHNNHIYVATQIPHQICIMDTKGNIVKTLNGENLFERATYIAVDPDSSLIYVSDPNKKLVIGINEKEEIKFSYNVDRPHGIVCVGGGKLFVADWHWARETIHLVNRHGEVEGVLDVDNCHCPQKLVYDKEKNTLLVTQWQKDSLTTVYIGQNLLA